MSDRFSYRAYRRPLRVPLRTAHGLWTEREGLIVRLEDETGCAGYGEIAPLPWFRTESWNEAEEICRRLGGTPNEEQLASVPAGCGCVRFALAAARAPVAAVDAQTRLPVAVLLPAGRDGLEILPEKIAAGWLAFKWKVGAGASDDELALLDDVLAMLPAYTRLRLDANGGWTRRQAEKFLARCAERPVEFVEQPLAPDDEDGLLGLARDFPVKLALDESVVRLDAARHWQERGWPGIFVIKPALCGPLEELKEWIDETKADVVLSSALETALGRDAILRFALAGGLTKRALGFGVGEVFGAAPWDGAPLGPLLDAASVATEAGEKLWNALG